MLLPERNIRHGHPPGKVANDNISVKDQALSVLERLHILSTVLEAGRTNAYALTNPFRTSLRQALTGGGDHQSFGVPSNAPENERVSSSFLNEFARRQWEAILYFIVGSAGSPGHTASEVSNGTKVLLRQGLFVNTSGSTDAITEKGFSFLLQEVNVQVWSLLVVYLEFSEDLGMDSVDVLGFLFTLGSMEVGLDYSTATLTATQKQMMDDLHDFGIIYRPSAEATCFYPTPLASALTSDTSTVETSLKTSSGASARANQTGFIVVETNYRIYAYTSSALQINILSLFCTLAARFPNMISGRLTKASIQRATAKGITADQIITYLTAHAHPIMHQRSSMSNAVGYAEQLGSGVVPPTVVDQIHLWQIAEQRMIAHPGYYFTKFLDQAEYDDTVKYAEDLDILVWRSDARREFFVTKVTQLQLFWENREKRRQGGNG